MSTDLDLYRKLFERGLGDIPIMRNQAERVLLGNLSMDKSKLLLKDRGLLKDVHIAQVAACWDLGIIGAVADLPGEEWESLSFLGPDHCVIPVDLSSTRTGVLGRSVAASGESLLSYRGSLYRGFKLMLDNNLLPVVLTVPIETHEGVTGLAVADFRFASVPMELLVRVNDLVRSAVDRQLTLGIEELAIDEDEFEAMFGRYKPSTAD